VAPNSLAFVRGKQHIREWTPPTSGFIKAFCGVCGSHLYSRSPVDPLHVTVRMGAFDGDPGVRPSFHQRVQTAAVWQPLPDDGLPRFEGPAALTETGEVQI
jgi:hypothetical protein